METLYNCFLLNLGSQELPSQSGQLPLLKTRSKIDRNQPSKPVITKYQTTKWHNRDLSIHPHRWWRWCAPIFTAAERVGARFLISDDYICVLLLISNHRFVRSPLFFKFVYFDKLFLSYRSAIRYSTRKSMASALPHWIITGSTVDGCPKSRNYFLNDQL